ncbi:MAG TPA: hypothetical protein VNK95_03100, partial [Caldilineaceae bacterium]|nr:hypothetical protein [Caldilineaceae bacterium]
AATAEADEGLPAPGSQVLAPETAFLVTDILADPVARQPAFGDNSPLAISRPAAVKTGTTSDWRDNWTVGYTRYLVAGVWAGNSDGRPMRNASGITGAAPIWHTFMEAVLARPDLLARLGVPENADWQFVPPPGLVQGEVCPPGVSCRAGGEYFRASWLEAAGDAGPLAGSVVRVPAAPVYAQRADQTYLAGFCGLEGAAERTALALTTLQPPTPVEVEPGGLLAFFTQASDTASGDVISDTAALEPPTVQEQHVRAWAVRYGAPVYLGRCDRLGEWLPAALALEPDERDSELRVVVDLAAAPNPELAGLSPDGGVPLEVVSQSLEAGVVAGGPYLLDGPILHNWACPGSYVMGQVLNRDGAPVAGVHVRLVDAWGNQAVAVSKSGPADYGMFDFPIYGDGPQNLVVTVVDEAGNPLSAEIVIPHKQDAASDTPCHHLVLRGG